MRPTSGSSRHPGQHLNRLGNNHSDGNLQPRFFVAALSRVHGPSRGPLELLVKPALNFTPTIVIRLPRAPDNLAASLRNSHFSLSKDAPKRSGPTLTSHHHGLVNSTSRHSSRPLLLFQACWLPRRGLFGAHKLLLPLNLRRCNLRNLFRWLRSGRALYLPSLLSQWLPQFQHHRHRPSRLRLLYIRGFLRWNSNQAPARKEIFSLLRDGQSNARRPRSRPALSLLKPLSECRCQSSRRSRTSHRGHDRLARHSSSRHRHRRSHLLLPGRRLGCSFPTMTLPTGGSKLRLRTTRILQTSGDRCSDRCRTRTHRPRSPACAPR